MYAHREVNLFGSGGVILGLPDTWGSKSGLEVRIRKCAVGDCRNMVSDYATGVMLSPCEPMIVIKWDYSRYLLHAIPPTRNTTYGLIHGSTHFHHLGSLI